MGGDPVGPDSDLDNCVSTAEDGGGPASFCPRSVWMRDEDASDRLREWMTHTEESTAQDLAVDNARYIVDVRQTFVFCYSRSYEYVCTIPYSIHHLLYYEGSIDRMEIKCQHSKARKGRGRRGRKKERIILGLKTKG